MVFRYICFQSDFGINSSYFKYIISFSPYRSLHGMLAFLPVEILDKMLRGLG